MSNYVSRATQTEIQGLVRDPAALPASLVPPPDTPTPPDDMAIDKLQLPRGQAPASSKPSIDTRSMQPSLLLKRKNRPSLIARISLPPSDFGNENPLSPPPTETAMSPLPAANKLHAGHTPIIPCAMSPLPPDESARTTPDPDEGLSGPLTLPPQPGDGVGDTIPLSVLDQELEKLRIAQENSSERSNSVVERDHTDKLPLSRKSSKDGWRPSTDEAVDGVILKKPKMNMGAPLGQA